MKKKKLIAQVYILCLCSVFVLFAQTGKKVEPGYWENRANDDLEKAIQVKNKLNVADDEFAVLYVRKDQNYEPWAMWLWAKSGGDGSLAWPYTQTWQVMDGIGYMKFKLDGSATGGNKFIDKSGKCGIIIRKDKDWTKDGEADRFWDVNTANACVIFQDDTEIYSAGIYKPRINSALVNDARTITLVLSHNYGLDTKPGSSGFSIKDKITGKSIKIADVVNANQEREFNYARRLTIKLDQDISPKADLVVSHPVFEAAKDVDTSEYLWKAVQATMPAPDEGLGMTYDSAAQRGSFSIWAPTTDKAKLNLYKKDTDTEATVNLPMTYNAKTGIWHCEISGIDIHGWFYDFELENKRGVNKVLDPYARSMAAYRNTGGFGRAAVIDTLSDKVQPLGGWSADYMKLAKREDAIIYEVSVRDFTISPDAGVSNIPGTYKAFIEKMPYLKDLGITHIQLMPVLNFYFTDETNKAYEGNGTSSGNNYNWGYDPHNYFTPEGWFASDPTDPFCRMAELKTLINEAHKLGLGVLLDVVYNHMALVDFLDTIVPDYYFRTKNGSFTSNSGCGNDMATERDMVRRLIIDSTSYWVDEYKVDGFRFDLMGLIDTLTMTESYNKCAKINPNVLFLGEGWKMYNGPSGTFGMDQRQMTNTDNIAVFNDELRDLVKAGGFNEAGTGFITNNYVSPMALFNNMMGMPMINYKADSPGDNVQYIVAHDGLTLHDSVVHNAKINEKDPKGKLELIKRLKMGNFIALTSQGIAFLHAGQERGRTKPGERASSEKIGNFIRNSYDSADDVNQIIWNIDEDYASLHSYTRGLIKLRKSARAFRLGSQQGILSHVSLMEEEIGALEGLMAYKISDIDGYDWYIFINARQSVLNIKLKLNLKKAEVIADSERAGTDAIKKPAGIKLSSGSVKIDGLTSAILRIAK